MRLYRRGDRWWVDYYIDQRRYRESTGCTDQRAAERRARTMIAERERGVTAREAGIVRRKAVTVREAVAQWLTSMDADVAAGARSAGHVRSLSSHARVHIVPTFGPLYLDAVTKADVQLWRDALRDGKRTSATVNRIVCSLRSFLRWAVDRAFISATPAAGLRALRERPAARHRALTDAEVEAWKAALVEVRTKRRRAQWAEGEMTAWIDLLRETGLRDEESASLTVGMVDLDRRCIELPATVCKGAKARTIPLSSVAMAVLRPRMTSESSAPIFRPMARRKALARAWEMTGLDGRGPTAHDLRHTAACRWVKAGWTLTEIQHALGHESPATTARYLHRYGRRHAELAEALDRLTSRGLP